MEIIFNALIFCFFIQSFFWLFFLYRIGRFSSDHEKKLVFPFVSVIICVKNAETSIQDCLKSILSQNYDDFEIVVMDDYSQDHSKNIIQEIVSKNERVSIHTPTKDVIGKKIALTEAIEKAKGEWILITDADCIAHSKLWISSMMLSRNENDDIILGYGQYVSDHDILNRLIRFETYYIALQYFSAALQNLAYMGVGRNLAFRKQAFLKLKPFEGIQAYPFGDDDLIVSALKKDNNVSICLDPTGYTKSVPKKTIVDYFEQKRRHIAPVYLYSNLHKFFLGLLGATHIVFYLLVLLYISLNDVKTGVVFLLFRWFLLTLITAKLSKKIVEKGIFKWIPIVDFTLAIVYLFQMVILPFRKKNW